MYLNADALGMTETPGEYRDEDDFSDDEFGTEDDVTPDEVVEPQHEGLAAMSPEELDQLDEAPEGDDSDG